MADNNELKTRIQQELDKIRPRLQADGGDITLVDVVDGVVKVTMEGACKGCPMSAVTLHMGVERSLKEAIPEVKAVENINSTVPPEFIERFRKMG